MSATIDPWNAAWFAQSGQGGTMTGPGISNQIAGGINNVNAPLPAFDPNSWGGNVPPMGGSGTPPTGTGWTDQGVKPFTGASGASSAIANGLTGGQQAVNNLGTGRAATAPGVTPTAWSGSTGGHTGSTYNIQGFNPWTNLAQYNGGQYTTAGGQGEARATSSTPGGEDDINRVFRWTNDIMKAQGIGQNDPRAAQVFAANVERLKSEYGANGANWANSRFANFGAPGNPTAQGQQAGQQGQQQPGPPGPPVAQQQQQVPPQGQQGGTGGQVAAQTTSGTGGQPGTTGGPGMSQGAQSNQSDPNSLKTMGGAAVLNDPAAAVQMFMQAHGMNANSHSAMGDFVRGLMGSLAPTLFQNATSGTNPDGSPKQAIDQLSDPVGFLNNIFANGQGLGQNLSGFAQKAIGQYTPDQLKNMQTPALQAMLGNLSALTNFGNNQYMQNANKTILGQQFQDFHTKGVNNLINGVPDDGRGLWDFINSLTGAGAGTNGTGFGLAPVTGPGVAPVRTPQNNPGY